MDGSLHRTWNGSSTTSDAFSEGSSISSGIATGRAAGPIHGLRVRHIYIVRSRSPSSRGSSLLRCDRQFPMR